LNENEFEVVRIDYDIASIFHFRIDIPLSSESIQFGVKSTRTKLYNKVELREILELPYLLLGQHLGSSKILKIFMICNNVDGRGQTF